MKLQILFQPPFLYQKKINVKKNNKSNKYLLLIIALKRSNNLHFHLKNLISLYHWRSKKLPLSRSKIFNNSQRYRSNQFYLANKIKTKILKLNKPVKRPNKRIISYLQVMFKLKKMNWILCKWPIWISN